MWNINSRRTWVILRENPTDALLGVGGTKDMHLGQFGQGRIRSGLVQGRAGEDGALAGVRKGGGLSEIKYGRLI